MIIPAMNALKQISRSIALYLSIKLATNSLEQFTQDTPSHWQFRSVQPAFKDTFV